MKKRKVRVSRKPPPPNPSTFHAKSTFKNASTFRLEASVVPAASLFGARMHIHAQAPPSTLNLRPYTLHREPCTPHPTLYTLPPRPCTLYPTPFFRRGRRRRCLLSDPRPLRPPSSARRRGHLEDFKDFDLKVNAIIWP